MKELGSFLLFLLITTGGVETKSQAAVSYHCAVVAGLPELSVVPAASFTICSILCTVSSACSSFVFNATAADGPCQLASSVSTETSTPTPLFIGPDADVTILPNYMTSSACEIISSPPDDVATTTTTPPTAEATTTTTTTKATTTTEANTTFEYTIIDGELSFHDCRNACTSRQMRVLPCPANQEALTELSHDIGQNKKTFLDGLRDANTMDFYDKYGNLAIDRNSSMWSEGSPNEVHEQDAALVTHWAKIGDTITGDTPNDVKQCICVEE